MVRTKLRKSARALARESCRSERGHPRNGEGLRHLRRRPAAVWRELGNDLILGPHLSSLIWRPVHVSGSRRNAVPRLELSLQRTELSLQRIECWQTADSESAPQNNGFSGRR